MGFEHFCFRDPQVVDELDAFIANTASRCRLLDVGAADGLFSLVFAVSRPDRSALAVDASPVAFAKLRHNIAKNHLVTVTPVECALSSEPGTLMMHYEWEHLVAGRAAGPVVQVEKRTGDGLCADYAFAPDVVKIDVEGHEGDVVRGLRETILAHRPLIFLELHADWVGRDGIERLAGDLREIGYPLAEAGTERMPVDRLMDLAGIRRLILRPGSL